MNQEKGSSRNLPCWCGSSKKWKNCHYPERPSQQQAAAAIARAHRILLKTPEQIVGIRRACEVTALILDELCRQTRIGVTTNELDRLAEELHRKHHARAAPLGYGNPPWPKHICTSLNEVICHGRPDDRPLEAGDILNIDVSCIVDGYFGDASRMVCLGNVSPQKALVTQVSLESLNRAIECCGPGVPLSKIGDVIEETAAHYGCSVVNQFVGHGVGLRFHEPPEIAHHKNRCNIPMLPGMTFTIEPMINAGKREAVIAEDQWTALTVDGLPSAQWEHTLLITPSGVEILTKWP